MTSSITEGRRTNAALENSMRHICAGIYRHEKPSKLDPYSIRIFSGLRYLTKYMHSRVVGFILEGNFVYEYY